MNAEREKMQKGFDKKTAEMQEYFAKQIASAATDKARELAELQAQLETLQLKLVSLLSQRQKLIFRAG